MTGDLFDYRDRYPHHPGFKAGGTSQEAAEKTKERAPTLRDRVLLHLRDYGPMTPDQCAESMGLSLLSVRPRFSELIRLSLIEETGDRRDNASGMKANVYRVKA